MKSCYKIITLLLICSQASAVHLSTDGTGEVLIFPYYTVNGGFNTLLTLTNTTDEAKALRVRFREAANSREVFAFNLYLGPNDVWTGALVLQPDIFPRLLTKLITNDLSCTYPKLENNIFSHSKFTGDFADGYGEREERLREGFIEVIEMGVLTGDSALATVIIPDQTTQNCSIIEDAWDKSSGNSYWLEDATTDLLRPSGGLAGNVTLIDVPRGISVSEPVTVLQNFSNEILHFSIDNDSPSLADGNKTSVIHTDGEVVAVEWDTGIQAVSAVLTTTSINNEFYIQESIGASTDWIMTMPTRQYHIDPLYAVDEVPLAPFVEVETVGHEYCQPYNYSQVFNRESNDGSPGPPVVVGSPQPPEVLYHTLCHASNSLSFFYAGDSVVGQFGFLESDYPVTDIYGSGQAFDTYLPIIFKQGYVELSFEDQVTHPMFDNREIDVYGLPIIGFSLQNYVNTNAQAGILANYAGIFEHKNSLKVNLHTSQSSNTQSSSADKPMYVAEDNIGGVLIYPYYTVTNGFNSLITVVNPTDEVKALSIRFLEGKNNRECLAFNLYLDAYDVWTSALLPTSSTVSGYEGQQSVKLLTNDNSCLVPNNISSQGQEFLPYAFNDTFVDGLGVDLQRCTEGHVEIIDMGQLIGADAIAAMHTDDGVPQNCNTLEQNWFPSSGKWEADSTEGLMSSVAGLYGSVSLIDVHNGVDITYDAIAITNFSSQTMHHSPGSLLPDLSSGNNVITRINTENGSLETVWKSSIDAVSALFMQSEISNDFVTTDAIGAQTVWVNLYPTKQFYVDPLHSAEVPLAPFSVALDATGACEQHAFKGYNREQMSNKLEDTGVVIGTPPPGLTPIPPVNCWALNVEKVETPNTDNSGSIFASNLTNTPIGVFDVRHIDQMPFDAGYMSMDFDSNTSVLEGVFTNGELHYIYGKPVIGLVAQKFVNGSLGNGSTLANYALANRNKGKRKIERIAE